MANTETKYETDEHNGDYIDLHANLRVIIKWRYLIIFGTLFIMLVTGIMSYFVLPSIYEAQAILLVNQVSDKKQSSQAQNSDQIADQKFVRTMNTYLGQVKSDEVMNNVANRLKLGLSPASLVNMVTVTSPKDSKLIFITVQNKNPELAAKIANTVSSEFLSFVSKKDKEQRDKLVAFLKQERQDLADELDKVTKVQTSPDQQKAEIDRINMAIDSLDQKIAENQIDQILEEGSYVVTISSKANVPVSPIKPNKKKYIALASLMGLIVFTTLAFVLEYFDNTIRTPDDIEHLHIPIMGVIPSKK